MFRSIKITFPVKKKNKDDILKCTANFFESDAGCCFVLGETNRDLQRQRHTVSEGCIIEDLVTDEVYKCIGVTFTKKPKYPILQVVPV